MFDDAIWSRETLQMFSGKGVQMSDIAALDTKFEAFGLMNVIS
jgi:hypothetical protein